MSAIDRASIAAPVGEDLKTKGLTLEFTETSKVFDPKAVYGDAPNPTQL